MALRKQKRACMIGSAAVECILEAQLHYIARVKPRKSSYKRKLLAQ